MNRKFKCLVFGVFLLIIFVVGFYLDFFDSDKKDFEISNSYKFNYNYIMELKNLTSNLLITIKDKYERNKNDFLKSTEKNKTENQNEIETFDTVENKNTQIDDLDEAYSNNMNSQNNVDNSNSYNNHDMEDSNNSSNIKEEEKEEIPDDNYTNEDIPNKNENNSSVQIPTDFHDDVQYDYSNDNIYPTIEACNQAGIDISFKYPSDIINTFCFSVAKDGKLLGYRLDVNCKSGDCDKYK